MFSDEEEVSYTSISEQASCLSGQAWGWHYYLHLLINDSWELWRLRPKEWLRKPGAHVILPSTQPHSLAMLGPYSPASHSAVMFITLWYHEQNSWQFRVYTPASHAAFSPVVGAWSEAEDNSIMIHRPCLLASNHFSTMMIYAERKGKNVDLPFFFFLKFKLSVNRGLAGVLWLHLQVLLKNVSKQFCVLSLGFLNECYLLRMECDNPITYFV